MGDPSQRRLVRKIDLERFLAGVKPNPAPNAKLEQYTLNESAAATTLYLAAYTYGDVLGKRVLDLGCGTGRLALGAVFLGAESVLGVDIDVGALNVAVKNSISAGFEDNISWVAGDIAAIAGKFDTVIQNPPFGVQRRTADRRFLEKALEVSDAVYSLHNHPLFDKHLLSRLRASGGQPLQVEASPFLEHFIQTLGGKVEAVYALLLTIPHMFDFHKKPKREIVIDLYVIRK